MIDKQIGPCFYYIFFLQIVIIPSQLPMPFKKNNNNNHTHGEAIISSLLSLVNKLIKIPTYLISKPIFCLFYKKCIYFLGTVVLYDNHMILCKK